uniref:Calx-beta domain-containing protein n=1 Tax=Setaria digitata TaxID=48799 RepID=A0A915Q0F5_9BILA
MPRIAGEKKNCSAILASIRQLYSNSNINCIVRPVWIIAIFSSLMNSVQADTNCTEKESIENCVDGMIIPIWRPFLHLSIGDRIFRGVVFFLVIAYFFLGVSILADRFMSSIEVITSMERTLYIKRPGLESLKVKVRIWNDTVSNLTLMALGSSAPEILLSIIEVIGKGFNAGDLGPNTIVGSAAFNLFMIIAICVVAVPNGEVRRQKHLDVFCVTAAWSLFAYIWMFLILSVFSPGIIEIWEGFLTFLFFPVTVLTAYIADIKIIQRRFIPYRYRRTSHGLIATEGEEMEILGENGYLKDAITDPAVKAFEDNRKKFIDIMKEIRKKNPQIDPAELQKQAEYEMITSGPKVQATRRLIGGGHIIRKRLDKEHHKSTEAVIQEQEKRSRANTCKIFFDPAHYTVLENIGTFDVMIGRDGGPEGLTVMVDYYTEDGSANAGSDYIPVKGTLTFYPEDKTQKVTIEIVDDDVFEEDEHFYLHLNNLRVRTKDGLVLDPLKLGGVPVAILELPSTATIMILDDDHAGVFSFEHDHFQIVENCGYLSLKIQRSSGCRGKIILPYRTIDGTAVYGKHYELQEGEITFEDNQTEGFIEIGITNTEQYERMDHFFIVLDQPIWAKKMSDLRKVQERFLKRMERKKNESLGNLQRDKDSFDYGGKEASAIPTSATFCFGLNQNSSSTPNLLQLPNLFKRRKSSWISNNQDEEDSGERRFLTKEELEVAELGKPRLGKFKRCQITIKESREFRNVIDRMLRNANTSFMLGTTSWREQFRDALTIHGGSDDEKSDDEEEEEDDGEVSKREITEKRFKPTFFDYFMHFLSLPWKLFFATIPPTDYWGGWACFIVSILLIGALTALIGDLASHFGCWVGLKDAVTAISFVALGTSVPDTFASKVAAVQDKYADSSIGNVTGSNAVNVFLGIGIAWTIAAIYHRWHGDNFYVEPGTLAFSVTIFCIEALICIAVIIIRRRPSIGGELGGPLKYKVLTSGLFVVLWLIYLSLSALESYCIISGF